MVRTRGHQHIQSELSIRAVVCCHNECHNQTKHVIEFHSEMRYALGSANCIKGVP